MAIVSITEYAKLKGWSHVAVIGKIKRGIISRRALVDVPGKKKKLINSEIADLDIEFYGDETKSLVHDSLHPQAAPNKENINSGAPEKSDEKSNPYDTEKLDKYRDVKISTEELKARKLELEIAAREGRLLDADEVKKRIVKLVGETKDALLNVPSRIAPLLVSITDPIEMETRLLQELNDALANLSRLDSVGAGP